MINNYNNNYYYLSDSICNYMFHVKHILDIRFLNIKKIY